MPDATTALMGRPQSIPTAERHTIFDREIKAEAPEGFEEIWLGLGCFWGAERLFWQPPGVWLTAVGYAGGITPNATYEEVCSGGTGHTEVVRVVFDPSMVSLDAILKVFWEGHNPTQGMRQGNDVGTQYRSAIYTTTPDQMLTAKLSQQNYQAALKAAGHSGEITTEIAPATDFYYAEGYHQQYLDKNPSGYCGLGGTGVTCPMGTGVTSEDA
ncbi:MAG: peptide-methionine (S)-S-oxide reductase MsrA [Pseudomonadota bacterium]